MMLPSREKVKETLDDQFGDRIYTVEDGTVWVSGMNSNCTSVARRMAKTLTHGHDIPTSLVREDGAVQNGGIEFNYGETA